MPQLALFLSALVWGATFPATKAALADIPPFSFLTFRFLLGTLLVFGLFFAFGQRLRMDRRLLYISGVATVFLLLGYVTQTVGLQYTSASNSAFITALYVIFTPLYLGRFGGRIWLSAGLALAGLWLLVNPSVSVNVGDLLTLACAAAFAGHIACLETYTREGEPWAFFLWQMIFTTVLMIPAMAVEGPRADQLAPTLVVSLALFITGVLATGAFAVQIWVQQVLPAQQVALIFSLEPAYAAWLAWYFLGEQLDAQGWVGSGLIFAAVVLGSLAPQEALSEDEVRHSSLGTHKNGLPKSVPTNNG
ncbi:MAG: DMT family transporter [Nitrospira sp.]|nr:DMT family transporter [Nitrospira sp.]